MQGCTLWPEVIKYQWCSHWEPDSRYLRVYIIMSLVSHLLDSDDKKNTLGLCCFIRPIFHYYHNFPVDKCSYPLELEVSTRIANRESLDKLGLNADSIENRGCSFGYRMYMRCRYQTINFHLYLLSGGKSEYKTTHLVDNGILLFRHVTRYEARWLYKNGFFWVFHHPFVLHAHVTNVFRNVYYATRNC